MKFVCNECLNVVEENEVIRMPFPYEEFWCEKCHGEWADTNPYRGKNVRKEQRRFGVDKDENENENIREN